MQLLGSVDGCGPWIAAHRCWIPAKTDSTTAAAQSAGQPAATQTHTSLQQCKHAGRIPKQPTASGPEQRCQALLKGVAKRPQTEAGPCSPCRRRSSGRLSTGSPSCSPTPPGCSQICHRRRQCCMSGRSSTHTCPAGEGCQGQQAGRRAKVISLHARQQHSRGLCHGMRPPAGLRSALMLPKLQCGALARGLAAAFQLSHCTRSGCLLASLSHYPLQCMAVLTSQWPQSTLHADRSYLATHLPHHPHIAVEGGVIRHVGIADTRGHVGGCHRQGGP